MGFPANLLDDDERIVRHLHPHWITLFWPAIWLLVILFLLIWVLSGVDNSFIRWLVLVLGALAFGYAVLRPVVNWFTTHFVFTTHRVLTRRGLLHREGRDVPLARINDVSFSSTLFERVVRCGTLMVESAGERGQIILVNVPDAERMQALLYTLVEDDAERRASLHHTPGTGSSAISYDQPYSQAPLPPSVSPQETPPPQQTQGGGDENPNPPSRGLYGHP